MEEEVCVKENPYKNPKYINLNPYKNDIIRLYNNGMGAKKISLLLNMCGDDKILSCLRRWGIKTYKKESKSKANSKKYEKIPHCFYRKFKDGALKRGIDWDLSIKEIWEIYLEQKGVCILSGEILTFDSYRLSCDGNASLDRIDSSKGYSKENCQLVIKPVNTGKGLLTDKEYIKLCKKVAEYNV